jgi:hypothetical protein
MFALTFARLLFRYYFILLLTLQSDTNTLDSFQSCKVNGKIDEQIAKEDKEKFLVLFCPMQGDCGASISAALYV